MNEKNNSQTTTFDTPTINQSLLRWQRKLKRSCLCYGNTRAISSDHFREIAEMVRVYVSEIADPVVRAVAQDYYVNARTLEEIAIHRGCSIKTVWYYKNKCVVSNKQQKKDG